MDAVGSGLSKLAATVLETAELEAATPRAPIEQYKSKDKNSKNEAAARSSSTHSNNGIPASSRGSSKCLESTLVDSSRQ